MRRAVGVAPIAAALLISALATAADAAFKNVEVGAKAPPFALQDADGKVRESAELLRGSVSVVVFFATWSPRSREILEDLERLRAEVGAKPLAVIAINVEHLAISGADRAAARALAADARSSATLLFDDGLVAFDAYGTMAVPSSMVVDAEGRVTYALAGYPMTMRAELADAVRKALGLPTSAELRPAQEYVPKNHALMYYNFGRRLLEKGQDEKAAEQLLVAVERDPEFKKPYLELGLLHARRGETQKAREYFVKARELDPRDAEAAYQAAIWNLRAGSFEDAETIFEQLTADYPDQGGYVLGLALTRKLLGREADYQAGVAKAAGVRPPTARVLYHVGAVAEAHGLRELAAEYYRRSLELALRPEAAGTR
ncbi:MAG TPA: redoxin domain-containing protein [bacterium]